MIKIELSKDLKKKIEDRYWAWFDNRSKTHFKQSLDTYKDFICQRFSLRWDEVERLIKGNFEELQTFKFRLGVISRVTPPSKADGETDESYNQRIKPIQDKNKDYDKIMTAFGYENFCESKNKNLEKIWNAYEFCKTIGVNVCVYCNRQYIYTVGDVYNKIDRPEIDHFFPKSNYPYLSCSLYNFIPSCHTCNHGKRDYGEGILYPYNDEFGKGYPFRMKFSDNLEKSKSLINVENIDVYISRPYCKSSLEDYLICKKCLSINASKKTFHLEEIYNKHKLDLKDLLMRYRNYNAPKIDDILNVFLDTELDNIHISKDEKEKFVQLYTKKIKDVFLGLPIGCGNKQYPLRKFKEDIIDQLDKTKSEMKEK